MVSYVMRFQSLEILQTAQHNQQIPSTAEIAMEERSQKMDVVIHVKMFAEHTLQRDGPSATPTPLSR
jgi:hypothetical protein